MTSPYINTKLFTYITLKPNQLNNNIYTNLKNNLSNRLLERCYKKYGNIRKVYEIEYNDGELIANDPSGSVRFKVTFGCNLCIPLKRKQIICKVDRINTMMLTAKNGPIMAVVTNQRINDEKFVMDNKNNLRYKTGKDTANLIKSNDYIKITILETKFLNGDKKIMAIGFLEDMATDSEKKQYAQDLFGDNQENEMVNVDEYINEK